MRAEDLKRIYELKNEPTQLSLFLDELSQNESDWDEILLTVIASAAPDMLIVLFDVSLERVQKGRCLNQWHHLLQVLTANGFRASYKDRAAYTNWLTKLTANLNTICELKASHPNNLFPQPKSIILCYCLFHYLETFTMITENTKLDECRGMETTLLKLISNTDKSLLLFPFCYLFWDSINVFTGSQTSNLPIPQLVNLINQFFDISIHDKVLAVKNSVVADSEVMKAWNSIIFDPAFENSAMGARKNVFVNNVVVEVLFASSSFSKDVEVRIDQDQRFYKSTLIKHEPEIHHQYLDYLLKKKLNPSLSNIFPVVMKCIVLRDTLCHGTGPKCCQTKTSSYPLCYLVQKQKQELNSSVSQISIVDSIFNGCLDLSQSLSANPERLHDLLTGYKLFLVNSCSSQVEIVQILNSLRAPTITRLQKEFDSLGPVNLLSVLMGSFKGDLDCDESFRDSYGSWETALLRIGIPDLNALAYIHLFQSRKSEIVRIKYLEKFEEMLSSTGKDLAQEAFQNSVGILAGQIQSKLLHDYTPEILLRAYFDILNLADSNLRSLFKVNVRLLFMLQQPANEDEELEEGEELGMGLDGPDDVTAAALLFRPRLKQIGAFDHTIEVYESSPNILIFPEILQARPDDPFESKRLLRLMVDYWTFASIEIPANVFNQSLEQVILHYFGSIANQMLDHVFVKFMFTHYWTIEVILPPLLAMVGNVKELLSDTVSPISALYDHFSLLSVASNPSAEERRFLEVLVLEITKLIPSPDPAGAKNQVKHAKKKTKPLEPKFAGKFPRNQVKFLAGLIAVMPKNMIELTALRIIEPLRSSGSRILQKFLVSLWSELKQEPSDLILEVLFPPLPDNVETLKSWSIQDWDIIANYLQSRLNSATPGPVCKRVLVSYLSSTLHEPYTNFVRETFLIPGTQRPQFIAENWIPVLFDIANTGGENCVAYKLLHNIVSTQFGAFIVKTDSTTVFFKTYSYYNSKFGFAIKPLSNVNCLKNQFKVGEQEFIISTFSADFVLDIRRSIIMFVLENGLIKRVLQMLCGEAVESCKQLLNELHDFVSDKKINLQQIIQEFSEPYLLALLSGDKIDDVAVADYCKMLSALDELEHSSFKAVISSSDTVSTLITFAQHSLNPAPIFNLIYKINKFKGDTLITYQSHWTNTVLWAIGKKAILTNTWKSFVEMLDVLTNECSAHFRSTVSSYCIQFLCSNETFYQSLMAKLLSKLLEATGEYDSLESVASIISQKLTVGKLDLLFSYAQKHKLNSATLLNLKSNLSNPMLSPSILRILKLLDPILLLDVVPKILELTVRDDTRYLAIELLTSVKVKFGNQFNQELKVYGNEVLRTVSLIGQKALVSWSVNKILEL